MESDPARTMKTTLSLFLAILSTAALVPAQSGPYTPRAGSAERKGIMDAARVPIEAEFKKNIVFKVNHLKVEDQWAFMIAVSEQEDGKPAYVGTKYEARWKAGASATWFACCCESRTANGRSSLTALDRLM
jgi:hypothetical protein